MAAWLEGRRALLLALIAGALSALAFAPLDWWPLMPLSLAGLMALLAKAPGLKRALLLGWLFGMGQFTIGLNWIAVAWTYQANMPAWLGWLAVPLLSVYLAFFPAIAAGLGWRYGRDKPLLLVLALAGGWAISEWLRGTLLTGFAWNPVGASLVGTPWLHAAPWIGTYGLSMIVLLLAGAIWLALRRQQLSAFLLLAAGAVFALVPPTSVGMPDPDARITIVQPNIDQADKWRPGYADVSARLLNDLSQGAEAAERRLLFWPEAAVVQPLEDERAGWQVPARFERLRAVQAIGPADLLITGGIALQSEDGSSVDGATNSIFILGRDGEIDARYDKAHLLPFGEYLPWRGLLEPLGLARLAPGAFDFSAGPGAETIDLPGWGKVGMQVCYEIVFPGKVVAEERPDFIFNPSNDAWFGAWGPPQHLAQARLRAAEEALPVLRSTPTGISAVIDANGQVLERLDWRTAGIIDTVLPSAGNPTAFARYGNIIPLILAFLLLGVAVVRRAR